MELDLPTIIQGGAVGICVLLVFLVYFIIKRIFDFMGNHIDHNTEAMNENTKAMQDFSNTIRELKSFLMRKNGK